MSRLDTFQWNNLVTGTDLAVEIPSSSPELRAFVVIGAYLQTPSGPTDPSKSLNVERDNLRFWMRKYEVHKKYIESGEYVADQDLCNALYLDDIRSVEELEAEVVKHIKDVSVMKAAWKVDNPLP